jgi:hypothetical protein
MLKLNLRNESFLIKAENWIKKINIVKIRINLHDMYDD